MGYGCARLPRHACSAYQSKRKPCLLHTLLWRRVWMPPTTPCGSATAQLRCATPATTCQRHRLSSLKLVFTTSFKCLLPCAVMCRLCQRLPGAQVAGVSGDGRLFRFSVEAGGQRWLLAASSEAERQAWLAHLGRFARIHSPAASPGWLSHTMHGVVLVLFL